MLRFLLFVRKTAMSVSDLIAVIGLALTVIGSFVWVAWSVGGKLSKMLAVLEELRSQFARHQRELGAVWSELGVQQKEIARHGSQLANHDATLRAINQRCDERQHRERTATP